MARPKPEKKSEPIAPDERRVLPMELRTGDRISGETGEWEIIAFVVCGRPGKNVHARMKKVAVVAEPLDRVRRRHHRLAEARYIVSHDTRVGDLCGAAKLASRGPHMVDLVMLPISRDHPCAGSSAQRGSCLLDACAARIARHPCAAGALS